jgi:predicted ATPase/DNA-binding CsgD family transcriptional regulator
VDNCEHVLAGAGRVIADLLDAVPSLTILATSREPIGWIDEQLVTVAPLSSEQSLELFRQCAELAGPRIIEPEHLAVAQQICAHMHGHPLWIRLAAARMRSEPLPMILEQLTGESEDARLRWRHEPRTGIEGRHRTIPDVIAWSYELCGDKERLLFDRLSVFAPGYDANPDDNGAGVADMGAEAEAIEVVCADDVAIEGGQDAPSTTDDDQLGAAVRLGRSEIRALLERLVEQSLVSIHITADKVRYSLLETLRLFAAERLAERSTDTIDEPARMARRHCYYYRDRVLQPQAEWFGPAEQDLLNWAMGAWSNIRRAIDTSIQTVANPTAGLQICAALLSLRAPFFLGSLPEIRSRIEQTLAATRASQPVLTELELAAMAQIAWLAVYQGRSEDAEEYLESCVAACDPNTTHDGSWRDRPDTDIGLPAVVEFAWGAELMLVRRDQRAIAVLARARQKFHRLADRGGEAMSGMFEALAAGFYGSAQEAMASSHRQLDATTSAGAGWARSWAQLMLAIALTKHGDASDALELINAALTYQVPIGDQWGTTWAVHIRMWALARLISDQIAAGKPKHSTAVKAATEIAHLSGGVTTQRTRLGVLLENMGPFADETHTAQQIARQVIGDAAYGDAENRGSLLRPEHFEVQRIAMGTLSIEPSGPFSHASSWQTLSVAEQEVAILAAAGWPNSAIGARRGTSTKTTDAQLSSVLQKLLINSRQDIIDFVPPDQRERVVVERSHIPRHGRSRPSASRPSQPPD